MGLCLFAHFNADVAAAHFVRDGGCGAGTEEAVKDEVAGVGRKGQYALHKAFWFGSIKRIICSKKIIDFFLGFLIMTNFFIRPPTPSILSFKYA
jgi:hypothetical protein